MDELSEYLTVPVGKSCRTDKAVTDLPDPDSPTRERVFPFSIFKEISSTALKVESLDSKSITKFFISSMLSTFLYQKINFYWISVCDYKITFKVFIVIIIQTPEHYMLTPRYKNRTGA